MNPFTSSTSLQIFKRISTYQELMIDDNDDEDSHCINFEEAEALFREFFPEGLIEKYFSSNRLADKSEGLKLMTSTMFDRQPDLQMQEAIILFIK